MSIYESIYKSLMNNNDLREAVKTGCKDMITLESKHSMIVEEMTAKAYEVIEKEITVEPFSECFYTGGGIFLAVHQFGGADSDVYAVVSSEDLNCDDDDPEKCLSYYGHKKEREEGYTDEFGFANMTDSISYNELKPIERELYNELIGLIKKEMGCE